MMKQVGSWKCKIATEPGQRSVLARISTTAVDNDGDVVLPGGVDLTDFLKNPVVLFVHDLGRLPVGIAEDLQVGRSDIIARVKFARRPESHPDALEWIPDTILELFRQEVLRGFSVGFSVPNGGIRAPTAKERQRYGPNVRQVITRWKLLEFSVVPVPTNQDALAMAISKGWVGNDSWVGQQMSRLIPDQSVELKRLVIDTGKRLLID